MLKPVSTSTTHQQAHAICLMPTYGRPKMVMNSMACFLSQSHPRRTLFIFDDLGTIRMESGHYPPHLRVTEIGPPPPLEHIFKKYSIRAYYQIIRQEPRVEITLLSTKVRIPSLVEKYNIMLDYPVDDINHFYAVWDDDDIYLPEHLQLHDKALFYKTKAGPQWSQPVRVWSDYPTTNRESPSLIPEESLGRFHGSIAFNAEMARQCRWPQTDRATFDQEMIRNLGSVSPRVEIAPESGYVFCWHTDHKHAQHYMNGDQPGWYEAYKATSREIDVLRPEHTKYARGIIETLGASPFLSRQYIGRMGHTAVS